MLDAAQKLANILAVLIGGLWAYYQFFKGRVFRPRLELAISGELGYSEQTNLILVKAKLKNVGLSKLDIQQRGTAIRLLKMSPPQAANANARAVDWEHCATLSVFKSHAWIEPGESIEDQTLIELPDARARVFRIELRIVSQRISWKTWSLCMASEFRQPDTAKDTNHVD
jgi:hypothetical protein